MKKSSIIITIVVILIIVGAVWAMVHSSGSAQANDQTIQTPAQQEITNSGTSTDHSVSSQPSPATYTLADIAQHSSSSDCWIAINGNVYNITLFIPHHPGGPVITQACGKDATQMFNDRMGRGPHPSKALSMLQQYYIGDLTS